MGYATNQRAYRVFNTNTQCVEISIDVTFDGCNRSQKEKICKEEPPCDAIKKHAIGEVKPIEVQGQEDDEVTSYMPTTYSPLDDATPLESASVGRAHGPHLCVLIRPADQTTSPPHVPLACVVLHAQSHPLDSCAAAAPSRHCTSYHLSISRPCAINAQMTIMPCDHCKIKPYPHLTSTSPL